MFKLNLRYKVVEHFHFFEEKYLARCMPIFSYTLAIKYSAD